MESVIGQLKRTYAHRSLSTERRLLKWATTHTVSTTWESTVAQAAPATPQPKGKMNR